MSADDVRKRDGMSAYECADIELRSKDQIWRRFELVGGVLLAVTTVAFGYWATRQDINKIQAELKEQHYRMEFAPKSGLIHDVLKNIVLFESLWKEVDGGPKPNMSMSLSPHATRPVGSKDSAAEITEVICKKYSGEFAHLSARSSLLFGSEHEFTQELERFQSTLATTKSKEQLRERLNESDMLSEACTELHKESQYKVAHITELQ